MKNIFLAINQKGRENPDFLPDYFKFLKYLAMKYCPLEKNEELSNIFKNQDIKHFIAFLSLLNPNIKHEIIGFIENY